MEDVLKRLRSNLRLTDDEIIETRPPTDAWQDLPLSSDLQLVGKILTRKDVNIEALERTMSKVWSPVHGITVEKINTNRLLFSFKHKMDWSKAKDEGPWCFDKNLIVLSPVSDLEIPRDMNLDCCDFYVQVSGLPPRKRHRNMATFIANTLGDAQIDSSRDGYMVYGDILRTKVSLNTTKPLRRIMKLRNDDGILMVLGLQYERLPNFCYYCGDMDHVISGCRLQYHLTPEAKDGELSYGAWLKAIPPSAKMIQIYIAEADNNQSSLPDFRVPPAEQSSVREQHCFHSSNPRSNPRKAGSSQLNPHPLRQLPPHGNSDFSMADRNSSRQELLNIADEERDTLQVVQHIGPPPMPINLSMQNLECAPINLPPTNIFFVGPSDLESIAHVFKDLGKSVNHRSRRRGQKDMGNAEANPTDPTLVMGNKRKRQPGGTKTRNIISKGKKKAIVLADMDISEDERQSKQLVIRDMTHVSQEVTAEAAVQPRHSQ